MTKERLQIIEQRTQRNVSSGRFSQMLAVEIQQRRCFQILAILFSKGLETEGMK